MRTQAEMPASDGGEPLPPQPAAVQPAVPLEQHPSFGIDANERLFLKREQWAMRKSGRIAPVLPPNDLLWMIWERVDILTQQALLQRAMGRLDVPADLEDVPPEVIEEEAALLSDELQARGMDSKLARRAGTVAALAGVHDDDSDDDQLDDLDSAADGRLDSSSQASYGLESQAPGPAAGVAKGRTLALAIRAAQRFKSRRAVAAEQVASQARNTGFIESDTGTARAVLAGFGRKHRNTGALASKLPARRLTSTVLPSHAALRAKIPNRTSESELLIATKESGSFSFVVGNNSLTPGFVTRHGGPIGFSGYSWELFERFLFELARLHGSSFQTYRIVLLADNDEILRAVREGWADAGHASITKTASRSELVDFTSSWHDSGLAIMVRKPGLMQSSNLLSILQTAGGIIVGTLSLVGATLVAMAVALFIVERAAPGKRPVMRRGCCAGIKDSAILMGLLFTGMQTRLPSGPLSRPVAACCAMSSTLMAVIQTALLTVALQTTSRTQSVSSLADLRGKTVVVPKATTAMDFLYANSVGQRVLQVDAIGTALDLFKAGKGDAVVYDMPILTAFIAGQTLERGVAEYELVGDLMHREQYGIAMHKGLPAQELHAFNSAVLSAYGTPEVAALGERWLLFPHRSANQLTDSIELESTTGLFESNFVLITEIVAIIVGMALLGGAFVFCYRWVLLARSGGCSSSVYGSVTKSARCGGPASHSSARSGIRPSRQLAHLAELAVMDSVLGGPGSTSRYDDGDEPDPVEARADQPAEVSADGSGGHSRHAAPPGGPANALELHPAFGADAEERMALKREQWGMRVEGRVAPILQPLDLMWLIWERVDMIAQQSLLQRAMGRLDVPLDLEGVPAQIIEDESLLLSEELKARGMPPPLAQRAAIAATLAGIRDDASVSSGSSDVSTPTASQIADDNMSMPVPAAVGNGRGRASSAVKQATAPNVALALARLRRNAAAAAREEPESDEQAYLAAPSGAEKSPRRRAPRPRGGSRLASLAMTFAASWSATPAGDSAVTNDSPTASPT
ncbi:hypothetical protein FNF31_06524 [Cafeteria roenbergensis]|uniref:Uncharacterized protein n=1 Tax=Cafeteria roenbergensis TaxID=33653 RepID=A0A5A8CMJ1_CAFRO|nr:hypothetical protein FNF31_06524 [Cafeteria roenbergensis]